MANERTVLGPTLIENALCESLGGPRRRAFLATMEKAVPWDDLARPVRALYHNDSGKGGRPNVPAVMMLKCLLVQKWFGLSDPQLEEALLDSIAIREFVGIGQNDAAVDETSMVIFRKRLRQAGLTTELFDAVVAHLTSQGLILQEGTIVDATILTAPTGTKKRDENGEVIDDTRDQEAGFTKKRGRAYHGYKAHVATDTRGMVKDYRVTSADEHDSKRFDELTEDEKKAKYGDSAHMDKKRKAQLEASDIFCGIIERRVRGQSELTAAQKAHNRAVSKIRAKVEHVFGWWYHMGQGVRVRYRGLRRNGEDIAWCLIAYNLKRSVSLVPTES
jgi:IS5 family transposase